jgi:hypothetical protein
MKLFHSSLTGADVITTEETETATVVKNTAVGAAPAFLTVAMTTVMAATTSDVAVLTKNEPN